MLSFSFLLHFQAGDNCLIFLASDKINHHKISTHEQILWTCSPSTNEGRHYSLVFDTKLLRCLANIKYSFRQLSTWHALAMFIQQCLAVKRHLTCDLYAYCIKTISKFISKSGKFLKIYKSPNQKKPFLLLIRTLLMVLWGYSKCSLWFKLN